METPNRSIFAIQKEYADLADQIEANDGELTEELEEILIQNSIDFKKKAASYVGIIKTKENRTLVIDDEIKRLQSLKKSTSNTVDKLESILLNALKLYGVQDKNGIWRYEEMTFNLSTRKSSKCVILGQEELQIALIDKMFSITTDEELAELEQEVSNEHLDINYDPSEITEPIFESETPEIAPENVEACDSSTEQRSPLNPIEVDFLNNHLTYSAKLSIRYTDMVKVVKHLLNIGYTKQDIDVDIKIPVKDASAVVKSNTGFRIAKINTDYSLTIK